MSSLNASRTEALEEGVERGGRRWAPGRWEVAVGLAALAGLAVRVRAFAEGRSLWLDEAMLACNIAGRSFAGLLRPLDDNQGAPVGFLMLQRLAVLGLGVDERVWRALPLLASCLLLWLVVRMGRRLGAMEAALALALAACAPALIYYAADAKQYALDAAIGLAVPVLAVGTLGRELSGRRATVLAVFGAMAIWFSHPAIFVLAGAGATLVLDQARRGRAGAGRAVAVSACWVASFGLSYLLVLRSLHGNAYLAEFWQEGYLPLIPASPSALRRMMTIFLGLFEALYRNDRWTVPLDERMSVLAAVAWAVGLAALARRGRWGLVGLLAGPLAFAAVASMLHKYPLQGRMVLFTAGPSLLIMAAGVAELLRAGDRMGRPAGLALLAGLLALPAGLGIMAALERPAPRGARPVLAGVAAGWEPGDRLVVDDGSEPALRYYRQYAQLGGLDRVLPTDRMHEARDPAEIAAQLDRLRGAGRVWWLFTADAAGREGAEDRLIRLSIDLRGRRVETIRADGYFAYLYDFGPGESGTAQRVAAKPTFGR